MRNWVMWCKCLFVGHDWTILKVLDVSPAHAFLFGNAVVQCKRCGKTDVLTAPMRI